MQEDFIKNYPDAVNEFVKYLVQAGKVIEQKPGFAAEIAVEFLDPKKELGLKVPILKNVLTEPKGIKTGNLYPVKEDLDFIQHYMHKKMGIGSIINLNEFVDMRFADEACSEQDKSSARSRISEKYLAENIEKLSTRSDEGGGDVKMKELLNMEGKYLRFALGKERFGIEILRIIEIIKLVPITKVPNTPDFVRGVINLRGTVVPVLDLRLKIGMEEREYDSKTRIVILEEEMDGFKMKVGFIVDEVDVVCDVKAADIDMAPSFGQAEITNFIRAVVRMDETVYILLDISILVTPLYKL